MSQPWDPPDPLQERITTHAGRAHRSIGIVLLIVTALVGGGAVSYVLSQWREARSEPVIPPTFASTSSTTTSTSTTTTTTLPPTTTTTLPPTTTIAPVVGDHMVFADGYPLGHVSPDGFAAYQGDVVGQLRQGMIEVSSVVNFVGSQFSVNVRPLDPTEMSESCPIAVQPRAADNATPLGLWVEAPTWQLQPQSFSPVALGDPTVGAVVQLVAANNGIQPATPQKGSAVLVDLVGDGVPDLLVSATYSDDASFYRMVAVAADANPASAVAVMVEFGATFAPDGSRDPRSRGELRVDGVVEMTGQAPFELLVRRTTAATTGVTIRDLAGTELGAYECPR
ncbi:MAG TPA: hypothetical protein VH761_12665 [Ilumatobacteraceae bacterium]|jgi:hypothetical protein